MVQRQAHRASKKRRGSSECGRDVFLAGMVGPAKGCVCVCIYVCAGVPVCKSFCVSRRLCVRMSVCNGVYV